jgi:hypothetical protein
MLSLITHSLDGKIISKKCKNGKTVKYLLEFGNVSKFFFKKVQFSKIYGYYQKHWKVTTILHTLYYESGINSEEQYCSFIFSEFDVCTNERCRFLHF